MVSVIIVNYDGADFLRDCLRTLYEHTTGVQVEVIVIDNASTDTSREVVRTGFPEVRLIENPENTGFSKANNLGARHALGDRLMFLNSDTLFQEDAVSSLCTFLDSHSDAGAVGPKLLFRDGSFQLSAGALPSIAIEFVDKVLYGLDRTFHEITGPLYERLFGSIRKVGWLTGACMMVRREAFEQAQGFDESIFMYYEDKDLCKRLRDSGWTSYYVPHATVTHVLAGSSRRVQPERLNRYYRFSQEYYYRKHLGRLQNMLLTLYGTLMGKRP